MEAEAYDWHLQSVETSVEEIKKSVIDVQQAIRQFTQQMSSLTTNQLNLGDNRMVINPRHPQENQEKIVAEARNLQEARDNVASPPSRLTNVN